MTGQRDASRCYGTLLLPARPLQQRLLRMYEGRPGHRGSHSGRGAFHGAACISEQTTRPPLPCATRARKSRRGGGHAAVPQRATPGARGRAQV